MSAAAATSDGQPDAISGFKDDLASDVDLTTIIRKHITTGIPVAIDQATYFELRRRVSEEFSLHPTSVVIVGSSRMGFTLKAKGNPTARYQPFGSGSDIDVAVVSGALFTSYWDAVFGLVKENQNWTTGNGEHFARDLFFGWVTPQELPNLPRYEQARRWTEFFNSLTQSRLCGIRPIRARLYRDWSRLEAYQERLVAICRREERTARAKESKT